MIFGYSPFIFSAFYKYERLGVQDWEVTFDDTIMDFSMGLVQDLDDFNFSIDYIPSSYFRVSLKLDWFSFYNMEHILGTKGKEFTVSLGLFVNVDYLMNDERLPYKELATV